MTFLMLLAAAALPTFSGIQLGAAPGLPVCEQKVFGFTPQPSEGPFYKSKQSRTCIKPPTLDRPNVATIVFPEGSEPEIAWNHYLELTVLDGKTEGVRMFTISHNYSAQVVGALTAKFGKPTSVSPDAVDISGIVVPSRDYLWRRQGYRVDYETINDMDSGLVVIETDKGIAWHKQNEATETAKQTKL